MSKRSRSSTNYPTYLIQLLDGCGSALKRSNAPIEQKECLQDALKRSMQLSAALRKATKGMLQFEDSATAMGVNFVDLSKEAEDDHHCSICAEEYSWRDAIETPACGHAHHTACLSKWITSQAELREENDQPRQPTTCPCCLGIIAPLAPISSSSSTPGRSYSRGPDGIWRQSGTHPGLPGPPRRRTDGVWSNPDGEWTA